MKKNCWEFKNCGREAGGFNADRLGVCPATTENSLHNVHDGTNAGRACWVIAGTLCGGTVQGTFAQKYDDCQLCDFFRLVKQEEGSNYKCSLNLFYNLKTGSSLP